MCEIKEVFILQYQRNFKYVFFIFCYLLTKSSKQHGEFIFDIFVLLIL